MDITINERNEIVERYLWCIDSVIHQNWTLMCAAHLNRDDVYQFLAVRLIHAVANFDPGKGDLKQHVFSQLKYELLSCKSSQRRYGLKEAPYDLRGAVVSIEALEESNPYWESELALAA